MKVALLLTVVVGVVLGCVVPIARPAATVAAPAAAPARADGPVETVLERRGGGHFLAVAEVNGEPIRFVVDTGADTVALTQEDARRAHVAFDPAQFQVVGRGASGEVRGQEVQLDSVALDGKRVSGIRALVLDGSDISLLGQNYLRHVSVEINGDTMRLR